MLKKFINIILFTDLPIRRKFMLFSLGVLFWFVVMFVISIATSIDINNKTGKIVNEAVPYNRISQKITGKLHDLSIDANEIMNISRAKDLNQKIDLSMARITDIRSFISALLQGGQIHDINRDNNKIMESFTIMPPNGIPEVKRYSNDLQPLIDTIDMKLSEIAKLKTNILNNRQKDDGLLAKNIKEYEELLSAPSSLSNEFSAETVKIYTATSEKIKYVTKFTSYAFTGVLLIATTLLVLFTMSISKSIAEPVESITNQIRSLGDGDINSSRKIEIRSKDEIGLLSEDFNMLMDEIYEMSTFKKVIEEDDSLEDVYSRLGKVFSDKFGLDEFIIYEVSNSQNKMKPVYPIILNENDIFCNEEILHNCTLCKVKKTGHTVSSATYPEICRQFKSGLDKAHICIPMTVSGNTGGVAQFIFDKGKFVADKKDKRMFKAEQYIKESLSVIEAKRLTNTLRESALKDAMTGLYNRRFLQEYTETLVAGVIRRKKNLGLVMCDLDFFKQVNDEYGHNVGDSVLKETSNTIEKCVRASDLVIRFGGEEFLILMLDINEGDTFQVSEKIRETVGNTKIKVSEGTIKKTISLGISEFPTDTESFWQAIKFADVALYKAKESGRNKTVRFNKEMWTEEEF
ncbi:MAG: diguanylate cyclase [Thermodesulfovibrionia bacterium]|nr:diguanylate cyclase [Thermodesulfovibrionia bacterium]